ncbi:hypothetical protein [Hyphococcus sp.]|uniref:hypothetical protein n=1 Tax=Hyphococcus sp. TaxID=2038636 RepID=UPI003D132E13
MAPLGVIVTGLMYLYLGLLESVIVEGAEVDLGQAGNAIRSIAESAAPYAFIYVAIYGAFFAIQFGFQAIAAQNDAKHEADANRPLSHAEQRYIHTAMDALTDYLENKSHGWAPRFTYIFFLGVLFASFMGFPWAAILAEDFYVENVFVYELDDLDVIVWNGPAYIGGAISFFLFGIAAAWSLAQYAGARITGFGEYLHVKTGWNSLSSSGRQLSEYALIVARFVRLRRLHIHEEFSPLEFLRAAFLERQGYVYKTTLFLGVIAAVMLVLDVRWFQVVHIDGILRSPYYTLETKHADIADIDRIELRCFLYGDEDDENRNLALKYLLERRGEFSIEISLEGYGSPLWAPEDVDAELGRIEKLDAQIRASGVEAVKADKAGMFWPGRAGYADDCAELVSERYDAALAARFLSLLTPTQTGP